MDLAWPHLQKKDQGPRAGTGRGQPVRLVEPATRISAAEALELIVRGRPAAKQKGELAEIVRTGWAGPDRPHRGRRRAVDPPRTAARSRQADIDRIRALAQLAIEVEELTTNQASARAMIHRVRAEVKRTGLEPIDRAGDVTSVRSAPARTDRSADRRRDAAWSSYAPGMCGRRPTEEVLIAKAVVQDRS